MELAGSRVLRSIAGFPGRSRHSLVALGAVVSQPPPSSDAIGVAASGCVSAAIDAGCGCHIDELDVTALSAECQQPCQQSVKNPVNRVSEE